MDRAVLLISLTLTISASALGQDLNRLQSRAQKALSLRSSLNVDKSQVTPYIESKSRQQFLEGRPFPISDAHMTGLEFTDDPKLVYVIFRAKVLLPEIGSVPRTGREAWVWDNKDWFLRLEDAGNPFAVFAQNKAPESRSAKPVPFELSTDRI